MTRLAAWFLVLAAVLPGPAFAGGAVEIGYVESFDHPADSYAIASGGAARKVAILGPVLDGDVVSVKDPGASITLRLVGSDNPVVVTQANQGAPLHAELPRKSFWSGLFDWTGASVAVFDTEQRQQVTASIRGDAESDLSAPLLATPQKLLAGKRSLVIGWATPRTISIRITGKGGKVVAEGRGSGGLWATPSIDWKAGSYRIELSNGADKLTQSLQFVAPKKGPVLPDALTDDAAPRQLRAVATGAWYAAEDPSYLLEALQQVAPDARKSRPARLLAIAFINGERPPPPPLPRQ